MKYILLVFSILLFSGCQKEEVLPAQGTAPEGQPTRLTLNLSAASMGSGARTRVVPADKENEIENLRVMIFKDNGEIATNTKYTGPFTSVTGGISLTIDTYSGNNRTLCIITNVYNAQLEKALSAVTTYQQLQDLKVTATDLSFGLNDKEPLMMTAVETGLSIQPGQNTIRQPITLSFLASKVTLIVKDKTPADQQVIIVGWDVQDAPMLSYVFPRTEYASAVGENTHWLTTKTDQPFESTGIDPDTGREMATQSLYFFENPRGRRVSRPLPTDAAQKYPNMSFSDTDHRGKGWFKPERATAIVITAMHKTATATKQVKAHIYLGADNHSDYDLLRGNHYTFTVTVNGLNDINIDSNVEYQKSDFLIDHGTNLAMDAHPDFRPMRIMAPKGTVTMEILDSQERTYDQSGFDATWLKISPLNLMYHQVRQWGYPATWQQDADPESKFVRGRYIPHMSVRENLSQDQKWWVSYPGISVADNDDDVMTFAAATYRMCYKITDIPFESPTTAGSKTLCVYADEYLVPKGTPRSAKIRFSFYKEGGNPDHPEVKIYDISQDGYLTPFDESVFDSGLTVIDKDGKPTQRRKRFILENTEEVRLAMNPGIDPSVQRTNMMQYGFLGILLYNEKDGDRNGKYVTANAVYTDVQRNANNEPVGFGKATNSYRPMYGNGITGGTGPIPPYAGSNSGEPYYYPDAAANIYHPIYKSSAARYCHEKNRDVNGDGVIDESEAHWYMPSMDQVYLIQIGIENKDLVTEFLYDSYFFSNETNLDRTRSMFLGFYPRTNIVYKNTISAVRCVRDL